MNQTYQLRVHWGVSRARNTQGYTLCALYVDGKRVTACNGGGYDMKGTVIGDWIAAEFADRLRKLNKEYYGLTFHDPEFDSSKAIVPGTKKTVKEREQTGDSIGLERYQAFYRASSKLPTRTHVIPLLDGACGLSSMEQVLNAIGGTINFVKDASKDCFYTVTVPRTP